MIGGIIYDSRPEMFGNVDDAPQEPSAAAYAGRYAPSRSVVPGASVDPVSDVRSGQDGIPELEDARRTAAPFAFLHDEVPNLVVDLKSAVRDGDFDRARSIQGSLAEWRHDNLPLLQAVRRQDLGPKGRWLVALADDLYQDRYIDDGTRAALRQDSPEMRAQRVSRFMEKNGVGMETASAMLFSDDLMHEVYAPYGKAMAAELPANATPEVAEKFSRARNAAIANFREVEPVLASVKSRYAEAFGDEKTGYRELAQLVSGFERLFNADGGVAGRALFSELANGYVQQAGRSGAMSVNDYLGAAHSLYEQTFKAFNGVDVNVGGNTVAGSRLAGAEARSCTAALLHEMADLGGEALTLDGPAGRLYASALVGAAKDVERVSREYGAILRQGTSGMSRMIARLALKRAGVGGIDDGGLESVIEGLDATVGRIGGPKVEAPQTMAGEAQARQAVPPDAQASVDHAQAGSAVEASVRKAVGAKLLEIRREHGFKTLQETVRAVEASPDLDAQLRAAAADAVNSHVVDESLAHEVAGDMYKAVYGAQAKTFAKSLMDRSGVWDAQGNVVVAPRKAFDLAPELTQRDIALLDRNPVDMLPALKGNWEAEDQLDRYVDAVKRSVLPGGSGKRAKHEQADAMVKFANEIAKDTQPFLDMGEQRLLQMVIRDDAPFSKKAMYEGDFANLRALVKDASEGNVDALLTAAMLHDKYKVTNGPTLLFMKTLEKLRETLVQNGVRDLKGNVTSQVVKYFTEQGRTSTSVLLDNGFITAEGKLSMKNALRTMQIKQAEDPIYAYRGGEVNPDVTPEQQAARRAMSIIFPGDATLRERAKAYRASLMAEQGYSAADADIETSAYKERMSAALRNRGVAGMLQTDADERRRRTYYEPRFASNGLVDYMTATPVEGGRRLTQEEALDYFKEQDRVYRERYGRPLDMDRLVRFSGAEGRARYLETVQILRAGALSQSKQQGKQNAAAGAGESLP